MRTISEHFSRKHQQAFSAALPRLRKLVGTKAFKLHNHQYGAAGNTLRAYRAFLKPPSAVFRSWAAKVSGRLPSNLERHLATRDAFLHWHASLARQLQHVWRREQMTPLNFAHQFKLVDLFVKWLSEHDFGSTSITEGFIMYANSALDRQVLAKLNECLSGALPIRAPSMGHISNEHTYAFCQDLIAEFAGSCGGTPLLFDYYAWRRGG